MGVGVGGEGDNNRRTQCITSYYTSTITMNLTSQDTNADSREISQLVQRSQTP